MKKTAVLVSCFNWYEKRLRFVRSELVKKGFEVTILLSDFDHIKKEVICDRFEECQYICVPPYVKNISFQRIWSHFSFGTSVSKQLEIIKPDLLYVLLPPNNLANHCYHYKKKYPKTKLVLDVIDLWPESMPLPFLKHNPLALAWKKMRDRGISLADAVVLECSYYRSLLAETIQTDKVSVLQLYSEYSPQEISLADQLSEEYLSRIGQKYISFAYIGSLNAITDYESIEKIACLFLEQGYQVAFHIVGEGQYRQIFIQKLKKLGIEVSYYGMVFNAKEKIRLVTQCDYALNMMTSQVAVGLTLKSIDYFSIGLPVINNIKGDTWDLVEQKGIGFNVTDDLSELIQSCQDADTKAMRQAVREMFLEHFTQEAFEKEVESCLKEFI